MWGCFFYPLMNERGENAIGRLKNATMAAAKMQPKCTKSGEYDSPTIWLSGEAMDERKNNKGILLGSAFIVIMLLLSAFADAG